MENTLCFNNYFDINIEDIFLESLSRYITGETSELDILNESIEYNPDLSEFKPLLEAVKEIKDCNDTLNELKTNKDENVINKLLTSLKKLYDWYFKAEPNKKYKTFHTVLKISVTVLSIVLPLIYPYSKAVTKLSATKLGKMIPNIKIGKNIGNNSVVRSILSKIVITKVTKSGKIIITREGIILTVIRVMVLNVCKLFSDILHNEEIRANQKNIDENIKKLDSMIDEYNDMIKKSDSDVLIKNLTDQRNELEKTLAKLIKIRNESAVK